MKPYRVFLMLVAGIGIGWAVRGLIDDGDSKYRRCVAASAELVKEDAELKAATEELTRGDAMLKESAAQLSKANDSLRAADAELKIQTDRCLSVIRRINASTPGHADWRVKHNTLRPSCNIGSQGIIWPYPSPDTDFNMQASNSAVCVASNGTFHWLRMRDGTLP